MKTRKKKQTKQGISLIVLVITIIVMIILAAAIILSLSSNGIIDRANEAVDKTNVAQVQALASTIWAEVYLDNREGKIEIFDAEVIARLEETLGLKETEKIEDYYDITFFENGVEIKQHTVNAELNHVGKIPVRGAYCVGVTSNQIGEYTGITALYLGGEEEDSTGINSTLKFGVPYFAVGDNTTGGVLHIDGSGEFYIKGQPSYFPEDSFVYDGNNILFNGSVIATISNNGEVDATAFIGVVLAQDTTRGYFPTNVNNGDIYLYGEYLYRYNYKSELITWALNDEQQGWGVRHLTYASRPVSYYGDILESINSKPVNSIEYIFGNRKTLTVIPRLPKNVTNIGRGAFVFCEGLTSVIIPNTITSIGDIAFSGCINLTSVTIPRSVTSISSDAFIDCESLSTIIFNGTVEQWNSISLGDGWASDTIATKVICRNGIIDLS